MKKTLRVMLLAGVCLLVSCEQDCGIAGTPGTTYTYSYADSAGVFHVGSVTVNENGNGVIGDVPSDVDCDDILRSVVVQVNVS